MCFSSVDCLWDSHLYACNEMTLKKKFLILFAGLLILGIGVIVFFDLLVGNAAKNRLHDTVEDVPHRKIGLVLGTSPISTRNLLEQLKESPACHDFAVSELEYLDNIAK